MVEDPIWNLIAKKLSGEANEDELRDLERLLRQSPELHYPVEIINDLWRADVSNDQNKAHEAFDRHMLRIRDMNMPVPDNRDEAGLETTEMPVKRKWVWPALAGAFFLGALFFGLRFFGSTPAVAVSPAKAEKPAFSQISTKKNSKTKLILSDGTQVWLNAGSSLIYDSAFNKSLREVTLTGEGFFDVAKNRNKPFVIHTPRINIRVLGTEFNVRSYASDKTTEASLIRGSIEVTFKDNPSSKIILKPNQKIVVDNNREFRNVPGAGPGKGPTNEMLGAAIKNLTYEYKTGAIVETSWVQNKLVFQDESFEQIAHQLERWYGVTIHFSNDRLKDNYLTGSFTNETVQQALDALKLTASFQYQIDKSNNVNIY